MDRWRSSAVWSSPAPSKGTVAATGSEVFSGQSGLGQKVLGDHHIELFVTARHDTNHPRLQFGAAMLAVRRPLRFFDARRLVAHPSNATRDRQERLGHQQPLVRCASAQPRSRATETALRCWSR